MFALPRKPVLTRKRVALTIAATAGALYLVIPDPAFADASTPSCVPRSMVGSDGWAHSVPADGRREVKIPACPDRVRPRPKSSKPHRRNHLVCRRYWGTWWARGRDEHGHGGHRANHKGLWHIDRRWGRLCTRR